MRNCLFAAIHAFLWLGLLCDLNAADTAKKVLFKEDFSQPLGERWKQIRFHDPTDYHVSTNGSNTCLIAFAKGGCSALATKVDLKPEGNVICSWRWKIDRLPKGASDDKLGTFDHTARVLIAFDTWIGPPRTINYVWANHAPTNSTFEHPLSGRTKFLVVESGDSKAGEWLTFQRNVRDDWNRLFNEPMPKIVAVGVFTDSHHTGTPVTAWYEDIELKSE